MRKGGFEHVAEQIGELRSDAALLPDHAARKGLLLQTAACCAIDMNKPARTGDMAGWCIGRDLCRDTRGSWHLAWRQGKTDRKTEAGELWPEISDMLDELILCGRPSRFIHMRYRELLGKNWLTLTNDARPSKWPSERVKAATGVPSHDLRTLAADYMRRHDPDNAARIISTHLGHGTSEAGESTVLCAQAKPLRARGRKTGDGSRRLDHPGDVRITVRMSDPCRRLFRWNRRQDPTSRRVRRREKGEEET